ncbi:MAG TPA: hypothetical protein VME46_15700 [Acidimicrobiales bacterium]|nr:hypothetical protein [Acidimicrobiales bacterium]
MIEPATLVGVSAKTLGAVPVVDVVYEHPYHPRGPVGLRLRVDEPPLGMLGIAAGDTVLELLVSIVCYYTIGDPPGRSQDSDVRDDAGVWWHGYGVTEPEPGEPGWDERALRPRHPISSSARPPIALMGSRTALVTTDMGADRPPRTVVAPRSAPGSR